MSLVRESVFFGLLPGRVTYIFNPNGKLLTFGKCKIILDTKEELISGSTRLKAGTAQKICLNIISSMVMIKMGRVRNGKMSHMVPTNDKLRRRKLRIKKEL